MINWVVCVILAACLPFAFPIYISAPTLVYPYQTFLLSKQSPKKHEKLLLVMGRDKNLREMRENVNSRFTILKNCEIHKCQFSLFFVNLSERFANFSLKIMKIGKIDIYGVHSSQK